MRLTNFYDSAAGTVFSVFTHALILFVLAGWLRHAVLEFQSPLAVTLWSEPAPPAPREAEPEAVPRKVVAEPEPLSEVPTEPRSIEEPVAVVAEPEPPAPDPEPDPEPESDPASPPVLDPEVVAAIEPPPELPRPALPTVGELDQGEADMSIPALSGIIDVEPGGPADHGERGRLLEERRSQPSRMPVEPAPGRRVPQAPGMPESTAVTASPSGSPDGESVMAVERGVTGPLGQRRIVYSEIPGYPAWARQMGLEADVRFRIWVNPEGDVARLEYLAYSGSGELDRLAEQALRRWKFEPLPRGASQQDEWGVVPMSFTLVPRQE